VLRCSIPIPRLSLSPWPWPLPLLKPRKILASADASDFCPEKKIENPQTLTFTSRSWPPTSNELDNWIPPASSSLGTVLPRNPIASVQAYPCAPLESIQGIFWLPPWEAFAKAPATPATATPATATSHHSIKTSPSPSFLRPAAATIHSFCSLLLPTRLRPSPHPATGTW
jgi:hypothetical protein